MFRPARWWSEKNKLKVVFKLQFHASQLAQVGGDGLMISVVPADTGKPTIKSEKATVRDGSCFWESTFYETVKFNQDPKSGKIHERMYYFVVGTGSSKYGVVGEASIDFSSYVEATKVSSVSLPLKNSKTEAILQVSIQRMQESMDQREVEESENAKLSPKDHSLSLQLGNHDMNETIRSNSVEDAVSLPGKIAKRRASSVSDITMSSSDSSSGIETPRELPMKNVDRNGTKSGVPRPVHQHHRSWEWLDNSALEASTDDSSSTPREALLRHQHSEEAPDIVIEKLKSEVAALSRQVEMSDIEMQTLKKQIVKESKRGQDLWRETVCLKEERDALKGECEKLKASHRYMDEAKAKSSFRFEGVDTQAIVDELRQELNHEKEMNANLRIQLRKMQESNCELILAVKEMDEKSREVDSTCQSDDDDDALEELVKERGDTKEAYLLEQQIMDLRGEIEIYKRDKDELEMQMEQLALDYEITKQANHEMSCKLEQSHIQEQLKMQYESSSSSPDHSPAYELENHVESLENELKRRTNEYADSLLKIGELEAHVKSLEEEIEKQAIGFEADLEAITRSKVEQEQRAIRAEEMLKKMRWKNANTAERLQEEFRRLSVQMASTFEANENLAAKALGEANELRLQKSDLEKLLRKSCEEQESVKGRYETRLSEMSSQVTLMTSQIEKLENQKKHAEDEILMLRDEIEAHIAKNQILLEDMEGKKKLVHELEKTRKSVKEMELVVEQGSDERIELERRVVLVRNEAEESLLELNKMRCLVEEKELIVGNLESEIDSRQSQCTELKRSLLEAEVEKENLRKQVSQLRSDLKKREDAINSMEKNIKDFSGRGTAFDTVKAASKTSKPVSRGQKEVANLKERIKLLECQIKLKEIALETSAKTFLEKEKDICNKIEELEGRLELNQSSAHFCENEVNKSAAAHLEDQAPNCNGILSKMSNDLTRSDSTNGNADLDKLKNEIEVLKERNRSMEGELKEMQERYSDISLKFAEVEGERQQLVMKLRNLNNAK